MHSPIILTKPKFKYLPFLRHGLKLRYISMIRSLTILLLFSALLFSLSSAAKIETKEEKDKPIRIITNNWISQVVLSQVTERIFQKMGYLVEYVPLPTTDQWGALAHGLAHVQAEVWQGAMSENLNRFDQ
jgi:glycine betaine/proline transport system substrate-binding protein